MDNTNDVEKEFFTVKDIQIYLGIGQNTAYALLKNCQQFISVVIKLGNQTLIVG